MMKESKVREGGYDGKVFLMILNLKWPSPTSL